VFGYVVWICRRSALRKTTPTGRWVEVHEEQGRHLAELTSTRPVIPHVRTPSSMNLQTVLKAVARRWVEVDEDEHGGGTVDLTIMRPLTRRMSGDHSRVKFAALPTRHQANHHRDAARCDNLMTGYNDRDATRRALLAIYEAGKPDTMFHTRAPSSAALEKMLLAMSDGGGMHDAARAVRNSESFRDHPEYRDDRPVCDDDRPVKVKVECPPRGDTVFSFRVHSNAA